MDGLKERVEGLVLRFELLARCAEAYERLSASDPVLREHWKTEKELNAYHARVLRQYALGWSP